MQSLCDGLFLLSLHPYVLVGVVKWCKLASVFNSHWSSVSIDVIDVFKPDVPESRKQVRYNRHQVK